MTLFIFRMPVFYFTVCFKHQTQVSSFRSQWLSHVIETALVEEPPSSVSTQWSSIIQTPLSHWAHIGQDFFDAPCSHRYFPWLYLEDAYAKWCLQSSGWDAYFRPSIELHEFEGKWEESNDEIYWAFSRIYWWGIPANLWVAAFIVILPLRSQISNVSGSCGTSRWSTLAMMDYFSNALSQTPQT